MGLFNRKTTGKSILDKAADTGRQGVAEKNGHPLVMGFPAFRLLRTPERQGVRVRVNTLSQGVAEFTVNKGCVKYNSGIAGRERYDVLLVDPTYTLYAPVRDTETGKVVKEFAGAFSADDIAGMMMSAIDSFNLRCKNPAAVILPPEAITETYLKAPPLPPGMIDPEEEEKKRRFSEALKWNPNAAGPDL